MPVGVPSQQNRIWNGMMLLSKLVFLCQNDEIIMTHGYMP